MVEDAPKLPLGQPADEGSEFVVSLRGQGCLFLPASFNFVREKVILQRWVEFWLEECEKQVEEIYRVGI